MTVTETELKPAAIETRAETTRTNATPVKVATKQASPSRARKPVKPTSKKSDILLKLLKRPKGARLQDLQKATGWQAHSIRAALTGLRKQDFLIDRHKTPSGETVYKLMAEE